jgi:4'-phosphopantetheinyl transferase
VYNEDISGVFSFQRGKQMYLYLYQYDAAEKGHNAGTREERIARRDKLVRKALLDFSKRKKAALTEEMVRNASIKREPRGKPYFADMPLVKGKPLTEVHFSVSHSGEWWGCLMAEEPVGFDLEVCRDKVNYEQIARRFFTEEEREWIVSIGKEAFFDVWVRKEAFVKYLGSGLGEGLSSFEVIKDGKLTVKVNAPKRGELRRPPDHILPCTIAEGVKAAYCCRSGAPIKGTIFLDFESDEDGNNNNKQLNSINEQKRTAGSNGKRRPQ